MLSTSFEFRRKRPTSFKATLTLADGTVRQLAGEDVMSGSATFSDAVSSDGSFDIGAAIINRFDVTLNNFDRRFDAYDFAGATIVPYVGVELDAGGTEWLCKGVYGVDQPESYGNTIGISALDNMRLLEEPYSDVQTSYPASVGSIVRDICTACGLQLAAADFANNGYVVSARPDDDALTCLDVVSYAAQATGNFARCGVDGKLRIAWYDTAAFESEDRLDGDQFDDATPYASGDTADGGSFLDYSDGDAADGGEFGANTVAHVHAVSSATIATDDVVVTGIRVTAQDQVSADGTKGADGETALSGTSGYVLEIAGNPLVQYGKASAVAAQIAARVVGMRFRPFDVSAVGSAAFEAGDPIILTDRLQRQYESYITRLTYRLGGYEAISCDAETPSRNSAASYSAATKSVVAARNAARAEKNAREAATAAMAQMLSGASGLYKTEQVQSDGSTVYYFHDKPTLSQSQTVWKVTSGAFGVSTDGGSSYTYGVDANGVAILNQIYAVGLNADYIDTGSLTVRDPNNVGDVLFRADIATGEVLVGGFSVNKNAIYNDKLSLGAGGLYFTYDGVTISGFVPMTSYDMTPATARLHQTVPDAFQISSHARADGSSHANDDIFFTYVKGFGVLLAADVAFDSKTVNGSVVTQAYKVSNLSVRDASITNSSFTGDLGTYFHVANGIYIGRTSNYCNTPGARLEMSALSFGAAYTWSGSGRSEFRQMLVQAGDILSCGHGASSANDADAYISFVASPPNSTDPLSTKIATEGDLILCLDGDLCVTYFTPYGVPGGTMYTGKDAQLTYVSDIYTDANGALHWILSTINFHKGIMTTTISQPGLSAQSATQDPDGYQDGVGASADTGETTGGTSA